MELDFFKILGIFTFSNVEFECIQSINGRGRHCFLGSFWDRAKTAFGAFWSLLKHWEMMVVCSEWVKFRMYWKSESISGWERLFSASFEYVLRGYFILLASKFSNLSLQLTANCSQSHCITTHKTTYSQFNYQSHVYLEDSLQSPKTT